MIYFFLSFQKKLRKLHPLAAEKNHNNITCSQSIALHIKKILALVLSPKAIGFDHFLLENGQ